MTTNANAIAKGSVWTDPKEKWEWHIDLCNSSSILLRTPI